jgi:hypothetical protein
MNADKGIQNREWTRFRQAFGAAGNEWTRIELVLRTSIAFLRGCRGRLSNYPQITQITQITV